MFDYFKDIEADPDLSDPNPQGREPPSHPDFRAWCAKALAGVSMNQHFTELSRWSMSIPQRAAFRAQITGLFQAASGILDANNGDNAEARERAVGAINWIYRETVGASVARVALSQRSFVWMQDWLAAQQQTDAFLAAKPHLAKHPSIQPLLADIKESLPTIAEQRAKSAANNAVTEEERLLRLVERQSAASFYLGGMLCFGDYLVPPELAASIQEPLRSSKACLGYGTGWLLAQLAENAELAEQHVLSVWERDELFKQWILVTNGSDDPELPEQIKALATELGLSLLLDAEGMEACVCEHPQSVSKADANPEACVLAAYLEAHLLEALGIHFDTVFAAPETRHRGSDPDAFPKPENSLREKADFVHRTWASFHDPA